MTTSLTISTASPSGKKRSPVLKDSVARELEIKKKKENLEATGKANRSGGKFLKQKRSVNDDKGPEKQMLVSLLQPEMKSVHKTVLLDISAQEQFVENVEEVNSCVV